MENLTDKDRIAHIAVIEKGHVADASAGPRHLLVGFIAGMVIGMATPVAMGWWVL